MRTFPLDVTEIMKMLPHRYPFLLVDRVVSFDGDKKLTAVKNVTMNEPFFQGHFPGKPLMPGVLMIEALAQAAGIAMRLKMEQEAAIAPAGTGKAVGALPPIAVFISIDNAKFRKPVVPGDQLMLEVELKRFGGRIATASGKALVGGDVAAEADLMFGFPQEAKPA